MKHTLGVEKSRGIRFSFDVENITPFGGSHIVLELIRALGISAKLKELSIQKDDKATFNLVVNIEILLSGYMLGLERIRHFEDVRSDPLLLQMLDLDILPHISTLYRLLDRFDTKDKVDELIPVNRVVLDNLLANSRHCIIDLDGTVNTVHGDQEGATVGYNPRYRGRKSYHPLFAFDGHTRAVLHAELRSGSTPSSEESILVYEKARKALPNPDVPIYVRGDKGFQGVTFLERLEKDNVNYAIKMRQTSLVDDRMARGVLWNCIHNDANLRIEVATVRLTLSTWEKYRKVVLVRSTEYVDSGQLRLPGLWDFEVIVTNLPWDAESIWRFYNQRCTSENFIKELKYALHINKISKADFFPNAADLWLKVIAYNALLALRAQAPKEYQSCSIKRLQRTALRIPALLVKHARQIWLRLPKHWPHKELYIALFRTQFNC